MSDHEKGSDILAFTTTYGDRGFLDELVPAMRGSADTWFDWLVCLGCPTPSLRSTAEGFLHDPSRTGIQHLLCWPENRGQHHGTVAALHLAREQGYKWLLRLDDDIRPRTKRWLKKMVERLEALKDAAGDQHYRFIAAPRLVGLRNPLQPAGTIEKGQPFPVEVMTMLGGACRLHPVKLLDDYNPPTYDPVGRGDPESLSKYIEEQTTAMLVRFPDIRMVHRTNAIEAEDTEEQAHVRKMGHYWPWLGAEV